MPSRSVAILAAVSFIAACGGGRGPAPAIVVSGVILDLSSGTPVPGITVSIAQQSTVSDANGRFSLPNVPPPYVLTAVSVDAELAVIYEGLTRSDPTIQWLRSRPSEMPVNRQGEILGTIDGGVPIDALTSIQFAFGAPGARTLLPGHFPTPTTYDVTVFWNGPQTITGSVHALEVTRIGGLPTAFPGYAVHTDVPISDGVNTPGVDLPLMPPSVGSIGGAYRLPAGYSFVSKGVKLVFGDGAWFWVAGDDGQGTDFNFTLPVNIDATAIVYARAQGPDGVFVAWRETGIPVGATGLVLALPQGTSIIGPADGTTSVDAQTEFSWNAFPGGIFTIDFYPSRGGPVFHVVTGATRMTIPHIPSLSLPAGNQYEWNVSGVAPFASVDEAAGPQGLNPAGNTLLTSGSRGSFITGP